MASLLGMLGLNLPGLGQGGSNPFNGLVSGGVPTPPSPMGNSVNPLLAALKEAFTGQLGTSLPGPQVPPGALKNEAAGGLATMAPGTTAPAYDPSGLPPDPQDPMAPVTPAAKPAMFIAPNRPGLSETPRTGGMDPRIKAGIFKGESGGDYNTLFGFSNRKGGKWDNVRLTDMTVDQAIQFSDPRGPYAQWVNGQIGRAATPMGAYQIVGTTLKAAKKALGLTGNERMDVNTQDMLGKWILDNQGTGAWEGYRGPADPGSIQPVNDYGPGADAMSRPSGSEWSPSPTFNVGRGPGGYSMSEGDFNTATNAPANPKDRTRKGGGGSAGSGTGPDAGGGGGARKNDVSPDYKRYQARKNIRHLRGMSPVATIQAIANIGKGLRTQGGGQ